MGLVLRMQKLQEKDIDMEKKLQIKISNVRPIELTDLTLSLLAVSHQFERFMHSSHAVGKDSKAELLIKEVRSGSVIVELVSLAIPCVPLIWGDGGISEWLKVLDSTLKWLDGKSSKPPQDLDKKDYQNIDKMIAVTSKDKGSSISFVATEGGIIINNINISSDQAKNIQKNARNKIEELEKTSENIVRKEVMTWYQTRFKGPSNAGNKAIIDSVTDKPLNVIFENDDIKEKMLSGDTRFSTPWQDLAYVVDAKIQMIRGKPKAYKILEYYQEDTFDPLEDD